MRKLSIELWRPEVEGRKKREQGDGVDVNFWVKCLQEPAQFGLDGLCNINEIHFNFDDWTAKLATVRRSSTMW